LIYAAVVAALAPYTDLAREFGFHIMALHHAKKGDSDDVLEMILESTALAGAVDTVIAMKGRPRAALPRDRAAYGQLD
jgi:hypothetical protein